MGNCWRIVKGSQVAGLTFTSVQEADLGLGCSLIGGHVHQLSHVYTLQPQVFLHPSLTIAWYPLLHPPLPPARQASWLISQLVHILKII